MEVVLDKQIVINIIRKGNNKEVKNLLKIIVEYFVNEKKDLNGLYHFFSDIYDNLYHDILFKEINLSKDLLYTIEMLATPIYLEDKVARNSIFSKIL